jgi:predicted alpha/beta-fold hydrolase
MSGDYRAVLEELANGDGFEQIFFAGYSMGGNLVTKMAGEFGSDAPHQLRGVCAVCPALDLAACAEELERWDNYFYQGRFVRGLLKRYARKVELFPQRYSKDGFGQIRSVREFDDAITAPSFGFKDAKAYYESAGAKKVVGQIRVPYLLITAQDDPFVPYEAIRASGAERNPAIRFVAPEHGGHCGFVSRRSGARRFWAEETIVNFCRERLRT